MTTTSATRTRHWIRAPQRARTRALLAAGVVCGAAGCAFLEDLTSAMVEAGILAPAAGAATAASGLPTDGLVEVRAGGARGVGVVVEGGLVLTVAHLVVGPGPLELWRHSEVPGGLADRVVAAIVWRDTVADLCLLRPADTRDAGSSAAAVAGPAWLVTLETSGTSDLGTVSRRPSARRAEILPDGRFLVPGGVRPGDSGSPLVQAGRVVGIVLDLEHYADAAPVVAAARWADDDRVPALALAVAARAR